MAYDSASGQTVIFGGTTLDLQQVLGDTWVLETVAAPSSLAP
jgi:hypothetical protein